MLHHLSELPITELTGTLLSCEATRRAKNTSDRLFRFFCVAGLSLYCCLEKTAQDSNQTMNG